MQFDFLDIDGKPCPPTQRPERVRFECPRRPGHMCAALLLRDPEAGGEPGWIWDGNRERPSFYPAIDCSGCSRGFIESGLWRDA